MKTESSRKIYKTFMLIIVVALVTFVVTTVVMYKKLPLLTKGQLESISSSRNIKLEAKLERIKKILDQDYLGDVNEDDLTEAAIQGYVAGLNDDYTQYFTKKEMEEFTAETEGNYVGIGEYMVKNSQTNEIVVAAPIEGSPAEAAGIQSGDVITKVDGNECNGDDFDKISSDIKGKEGTTVKIEIHRDKKTLTFDIVRTKIALYPVKSEALESNIGYIKLTSFDEECSEEFKEHYEKLKKNHHITSLVIDLRDNGGGIVDEAEDILEMILDKGSVMIITVNKKGEEEVDKVTKKAFINLPIVVLVNENSASASEIFASALKENNKATIVGTTTYGKGVIQELLTLSDGSGLKVTTDEYYTAKRNKINKIGIKPDVEVKLPNEKTSTYKLERKDDTQLKKAIETLKANK